MATKIKLGTSKLKEYSSEINKFKYTALFGNCIIPTIVEFSD